MFDFWVFRRLLNEMGLCNLSIDKLIERYPSIFLSCIGLDPFWARDSFITGLMYLESDLDIIIPELAAIC